MPDELTIAAPTLTFRFETSRPVELVDLSTSLQAVARRFSRHVAQNDFDLDEASVKLYVRSIRDGSIIVDLTNAVVQNASEISGYVATAFGSDAIAQTKAIVSFARNMKDGLEFLVGRSARPSDMPASELKDLSKIVEPIAKDSRGSVVISAAEGASVQVSVTYNSMESNAIQNRAEREIEARREPTQKSFSKVLMYWHQASKRDLAKTDKVVIEEISDRPLKAIFDEDDFDLKRQMISGKDNPFNIGFLVDVDLITKQGKAIAYRVLRLYDVIDDEPD